MDRNGIKHLADLFGASILSAPPSAKWLNITCPFAEWEHASGTDNTPSFGVEVNPDGVSRLHCFSCSKGGRSLGEVIFELKGRGAEVDYKALNEFAQAEFDGASFPSFPDDEEDAKTGLYPFPEDWLASFPKATHNGVALAYLRSRKGGPVPDAIIEMLDLRYDPFDKRVCFPIRGEDGVLYGFHGRSILKDAQLRWLAYGYKNRRNPHVLLGEDAVDWNRPVVVAEAPFDYARTKQVYRNVISPMHAGISGYMYERMEAGFEFVTLFDADKAGMIGRSKFAKWAGKKRLVTHVYLEEWAEDVDAGDLKAEDLGLLLSAAGLELDPPIS